MKLVCGNCYLIDSNSSAKTFCPWRNYRKVKKMWKDHVFIELENHKWCKNYKMFWNFKPWGKRERYMLPTWLRLVENPSSSVSMFQSNLRIDDTLVQWYWCNCNLGVIEWRRCIRFVYFFLVDTCPFMETLMPLFSTFDDISGFQSQSGQPYSHLVVLYMTYIPRDSPLVQHLLISWQPAWRLVGIPHMHVQ